MSKINIIVSIKNTESDNTVKTSAILQDEIIKYKEDSTTTVRFNYHNMNLYRENNELRMSYQFNKEKKTKGKIFIKELNKELEVDIKTKKIKRKDNDIEIKFSTEDNEFLYRIEEIKWVY